MSKREYTGSPIDLTWNSGPWANNGETVDATDGETGTMTTIDWPEGATPREELNEDQIAVIEAAAKNPDVNSPTEMTKLAGLFNTRSRNYSGGVLRYHWPDRYWAGGENSNQPRSLSPREVDTVRRRVLTGYTIDELAERYDVNRDTMTSAVKGEFAYSDLETFISPLTNIGARNNPNWVRVEDGSEDLDENKEPVDMAETLRKEALDGSSAVEIADKHGFGVTTVKEILKGKRTSIDSEIPALQHTTGAANGQWVVSAEDSRLPLDHVEKVRSRVLDGGKIYQIAGDYEVGPNEVYKAVVGMEKYESVNAPTPPLESDGSGLDSEWYVPESETESKSDVEKEGAEQTEPETEPTLEGQSVRKGYTPQEPTTTDNTKRNAVIAAVALLISYLLGKRGGN